MSGNERGLKSYLCCADAVLTEVEAYSLEEAYAICRRHISPEQLRAGTTLWVEDRETAERLTMNLDRD